MSEHELIIKFTDDTAEFSGAIIRCKECKHRVYLADLSGDGVVEWYGCDDLYDYEGNPVKVNDNDYCSHAERRER